VAQERRLALGCAAGRAWLVVSAAVPDVKENTESARHLMTGLGAYCYIVWGIWLRHCLNERQDDYELVWTRLYQLPEVVQVRPVHYGNGSMQNGSAKKAQ
jgi:Ceramidase